MRFKTLKIKKNARNFGFKMNFGACNYFDQ